MVSNFDELLRITARKHLEAMVVRMGLAEVGEVTEESVDRYLAWLAEPDEELSTACGKPPLSDATLGATCDDRGESGGRER